MIDKKVGMTVFIIAFFIFFERYVCINNNFRITKAIIAIFHEYTLTYDIDKKSIDPHYNIVPVMFRLDEYVHLSKKIDYFIHNQKPIIFTMVGFPYKSSNTHEKVISSSADAAERYSLVYLQHFLDKIKKIYKPGVQLNIFTDGIIFGDLEYVSDEDIYSYEEALKLMSYDLPDIKINTMRDLCPHESAQEIRKQIAGLNPSGQDFYDIYKHDQKLKDDAHILIQRLAFELAQLALDQKTIKNIALQQMHRGMQYSNFLKQFRPDQTINCSVHYQKNIDKKIGLKLSDSCITPWHGVLVEKNGYFSIEHLKDIDQSKCQQKECYVNGVLLAYLKHIS